MKERDIARAAILSEALRRWGEIERACRKHKDDRGLEFLVGGLNVERYVDDNEASVAIDCKTGSMVAKATREIIKTELKKLGVKL